MEKYLSSQWLIEYVMDSTAYDKEASLVYCILLFKKILISYHIVTDMSVGGFYDKLQYNIGWKIHSDGSSSLNNGLRVELKELMSVLLNTNPSLTL